MYPILFEWGEMVIPSWHALFALGAIAAYFLFVHLVKKTSSDVDPTKLATLFSLCYVAGYAGARLFAILVEERVRFLSSEFFESLLTFGAMTFYGGFLGVIACGLLYARLAGLPVRKLFDAGMVAGMLGLAIGRIGCFLNGDDYGIVIDVAAGENIPWWAVTFPNHDNPLPRLPVQLLEAGFASFLAGFFTLGFKRIQNSLAPGCVGLIVATVYATFRFFAEFLRADPRGFLLFDGFSPAQTFSLGINLVCIAGIFILLQCKPAN
jgi:phosphatidylglycerol:prolipoprotein diacylglycerol transferase